MLEPVSIVTITVPADLQGPVLTDLSSRRAHVNATESTDDGGTRIVASVPEAELGRYVLELRSLTGGQAQLTITPDRYERAPSRTRRVTTCSVSTMAEGGITASVRWCVGARHPIARPSPHARHPSDAPGSLIVALFVQKYGGSSVADAESIKRVAKRIVDTRRAGHDVVVAVSAMGDTTDELLDLAAQVAPIPAPRELDMLLSSGERISMALLAMAIHSMGFEARSFTGSQAGMITDATHGAARIVDVTPIRLREALDEGAIVIVAGFQGFNRDTRDITTLGRGGSDTTAVALAAALEADVCEIYSDVDGIFTADPRVVPKAQKLDARLERGDARARRQRRQGAVHPRRRVRAPPRRADPRALHVQLGRGHLGARRGA